MTHDWQSWAALGVVLATAAIMGYRVLARKKAACGAGCGCDSLKQKAGAGAKPKAAIEPRRTQRTQRR